MDNRDFRNAAYQNELVMTHFSKAALYGGYDAVATVNRLYDRMVERGYIMWTCRRCGWISPTGFGPCGKCGANG